MKKLKVQNQSISFRIGINKPMFYDIKNGRQKLFATKISVPHHFAQIVFRNGNDSFLVNEPIYILCNITKEGMFIDNKMLTMEQESTLQALCCNTKFLGFGKIWLILLDRKLLESETLKEWGAEFLFPF